MAGCVHSFTVPREVKLKKPRCRSNVRMVCSGPVSTLPASIQQTGPAVSNSVCQTMIGFQAYWPEPLLMFTCGGCAA